MPFQKTTNSQITNLTFNSSLLLQEPIDDCFLCFNKINKIESNNSIAKCKLGNHYIHLKCINLSQYSYQESKKYWSCDSCLNFPFKSCDEDELTEELKTVDVTLNLPPLHHFTY